MFSSKKKTKKENYDYSDCEFECRIKKKTMFGTKLKYIYIKKNNIIINNVIFIPINGRNHTKNNLIE